MDNEIEKIEEINLNGIVIEIQELLKSIPKSNDDKSYFSFKDVVDEQDIEKIRNSNSSEIKIRFNYNNYDNIFWAIEKINSLTISQTVDKVKFVNSLFIFYKMVYNWYVRLLLFPKFKLTNLTFFMKKWYNYVGNKRK